MNAIFLSVSLAFLLPGLQRSYLWGRRPGTWQQTLWTPSRCSSLQPRMLCLDTPVFLHERRNRGLHPVGLDLQRSSICNLKTSFCENLSVACFWGSYLRRSRGCTWCFQSRWGSCWARWSTAGARWRLPRPARYSWWWLFPAPPAHTGGGRNSPLLYLWSPPSLEPGLKRQIAAFINSVLLHLLKWETDKNLTDSARCSQTKQHHIATLSVMQQFDELMQHDRDGRDTHSMLWQRQDQTVNHETRITSSKNS